MIIGVPGIECLSVTSPWVQAYSACLLLHNGSARHCVAVCLLSVRVPGMVCLFVASPWERQAWCVCLSLLCWRGRHGLSVCHLECQALCVCLSLLRGSARHVCLSVASPWEIQALCACLSLLRGRAKHCGHDCWVYTRGMVRHCVTVRIDNFITLLFLSNYKLSKQGCVAVHLYLLFSLYTMFDAFTMLASFQKLI